ncbi:protein LAZ1 [Tanacetum coccineum]
MFRKKDIGPVHYYLGMTQIKYALELLECANVLESKPVAEPMDPILKLCSRDGYLLRDPSTYLQNISWQTTLSGHHKTKLIICSQALSQLCLSPRSSHFDSLTRVLRYIKLCAGQGIYDPYTLPTCIGDVDTTNVAMPNTPATPVQVNSPSLTQVQRLQRIAACLVQYELQKAIDQDPSDNALRDEEGAYVRAFIEAKIDEELFLRQKAKIQWLEVDNVEATGTSVPDVFLSHYEAFLGTNMECDLLDSTGLFNKQVWDIVGHDVCNAVRDFFVNGQLLKEINHTFLALIPKVSTPLKVNDYRPISCCNVIYKCISKTLTNRIIEGIKEVVSENQSAFVSGRRISDNILITQELMHNYHRNRGPPRCAFKVDIQKAYDMVDWRFLGFILKGFGFHQTMINWIMACVASASFSLSINGNIHGLFKGEFDHLSRSDIITIVRNWKLLMYVLQIFIFARDDVESARVILESLDEFKLVSGLVPIISLFLLGVMWNQLAFFCNVLNHVKIAILNIMPFSEGELPLKYLGFPLISSRLLNKDCKVLVEKAHNRIGDWKNKSLSFAGRLQLLIEQLIRGFLWCNGELKGGKAKVARDHICLPKREGGLGLRNLVLNGAWNWPHAWLLKAPDLGILPAPSLDGSRQDCTRWRDRNGNLTEFSVKSAWGAIRPRGNEALWHHTVWFSHCIPRHAFHIWLVMRRSLKTQDTLRHWDVNASTDLSLLRCYVTHNRTRMNTYFLNAHSPLKFGVIFVV